jgi:hypothetical protein
MGRRYHPRLHATPVTVAPPIAAYGFIILSTAEVVGAARDGEVT